MLAFTAINAAIMAAHLIAAGVVVAGAPLARAIGADWVLPWMVLTLFAVLSSFGALYALVHVINGRGRGRQGT